MSDNTSDEEQQQQMEEIFICADIWLEVFVLLSPLELGQTMALISDRFDRLVDEHFKSRKWSLGSLQIVRATDGNGAEIAIERSRERLDGAEIVERSSERLPIPQRPLPNKVIGFEWIQIRYIDGSVLEFLQRIRRLFNSSETNVAIYTFDNQSRSWDIIRQKIWPLISDNICGLRLDFSDLDHLRQLSPTVLCNCTKLRSIEFQGFFLELPADDSAGASSAQAVAKWLLTPRQDGRPKMMDCGASAIRERLKGDFDNASEPANFIIRMTPRIMGMLVSMMLGGVADDVLTFELTNNLTEERLTSRREGRSWLFVRCPIKRDEDKWAVWEKEAIEWRWSRQWNRITIEFNNMDIGDCSICADIWLEVFALLSPLELGQTMALISDRFDRLVDEHFKSRKWSLGSLQIVRSTDGNGAEIVIKSSGEGLPIPQRPLPDYVIGFEKIEISYIDRSVIGFIRRIRRLFNSTGRTVEIDNASNKLTIDLEDMDIGDGMLDANNEGPNEPKK